MIAFRWDTAVHQTLPLFSEVVLACEPIIQPEQLLLWVHGRGLSFTLKPWANRGIPAMHEWFNLSFIPGAYLKQTSPPYKPATIRLTASNYQEVAVRAVRHSTWVVFALAQFHADARVHSHSHGLAEVYIAVDSQISWNIWMRSFKVYRKWLVQASKHIYTHTRAQWSHASVGLAQAHPNYAAFCC